MVWRFFTGPVLPNCGLLVIETPTSIQSISVCLANKPFRIEVLVFQGLECARSQIWLLAISPAQERASMVLIIKVQALRYITMESTQIIWQPCEFTMVSLDSYLDRYALDLMGLPML